MSKIGQPAQPRQFAVYVARQTADPRPPLPSGLTIRQASAGDARGVAGLHWLRSGGDLDSWLRKAELEVSQESPDSLLLVADLDGVVVGFGRAGYFSCGEPGPSNQAPAGWYLRGMIVGEDHRRQGIGEALAKARLTWLAQRSATVYFFANATNRASIELHSRLGFVELTRDFTFPGVTFAGGVGILFVNRLTNAKVSFLQDS